MRLDNARILVAGGTGELGSRLARGAQDRGAGVAIAGRDKQRLAAQAEALGNCPQYTFDAYDLDRCARLAPWAADDLGSLDGVLVAVGVAAFGSAEETDDSVAEHLFAVNALAPMAILRGALPVLRPDGALAALTGVIVDRPQPGMAAYSASKSALATWLQATRGELRKREIGVLDVRAPHMDTGLAERAIAGRPPALPTGSDIDRVVAAVLDGIEDGSTVLRADSA